MSLIDKAITHFNSKEVRELYIKEWDVTLYSKNLTLGDKASWLKRADGETTEYMLYAVIYGVVDAEGKPAFDIGDKIKLKTSVDPEIVSRIASFVLETSGPNDEEREKN